MFFAPLVLSLSLAADPAVTTFSIWPDKIPGPVSRDPKNVPTLTVYPVDPSKANGCAVVVCPAGAYSCRATAKADRAGLNDRGIPRSF